MTDEERQLKERMRQLDGLIGQIQDKADPAMRAKLSQILQTVLEFHGAALQRILLCIESAGNGGRQIISEIAGDELAASLLLLHDLHPEDLPTRVNRALEKVRPYLHSHGGNVELISLDDGVVRLRLQGSCHGCPSSAATLKNTIEEALAEFAPDAAAIVVEGEISPQPRETVPEHHSRHALPVITG